MISCWYIFNIFVDDEDVSGVVVEGLDVKNFGFLDAHFEFPYPDFQNEWRHEFLYLLIWKKSSWIFKQWHVILWVTI